MPPVIGRAVDGNPVNVKALEDSRSPFTNDTNGHRIVGQEPIGPKIAWRLNRHTQKWEEHVDRYYDREPTWQQEPKEATNRYLFECGENESDYGKELDYDEIEARTFDFEIKLVKPAGNEVGLQTYIRRRHLIVKSVFGLAKEWNALGGSNVEGQEVQIGDKLIAVNGIIGKPREMKKTLDDLPDGAEISMAVKITWPSVAVMYDGYRHYTIRLAKEQAADSYGFETARPADWDRWQRARNQTLLVLSIEPGGIVTEWNEAHPEGGLLTARVGDVIVDINGFSSAVTDDGVADKMKSLLENEEVLVITLQTRKGQPADLGVMPDLDDYDGIEAYDEEYNDRSSATVPARPPNRDYMQTVPMINYVDEDEEEIPVAPARRHAGFWNCSASCSACST